MLFHLLKKDFLIVKRYAYILMGIGIAIPLVLVYLDSTANFLIFLWMTLFSQLLFLQYILMTESKYNRATLLLCAAPYPRALQVAAKYLLFLLAFIYCYLVYCALSLLLPRIQPLTLSDTLCVLFTSCLLCGIYLPLYYRFGFAKTRILTIIFVYAICFGIPLLNKYGILPEYNWFDSMDGGRQYILLAAAGVVWLFSLLLSIKIYNQKDLA